MDRTELSIAHELFCKKYIEYRGNGVRAYCDAYDLDFEDGKVYNSSKVRASDLLTNVNIVTRIRELLDETGLNDLFVDNELKHLIWQDDDRGAKAKGIDIYNRIARRYDEKIEIKIQEFKAKFD